MPRKFKLHDGKRGAALTVRVTPRSRRTEVAEILEDGTLRVRVTAPPVDGKANAALIRFLAKVLEIRVSRIEIVAGEKGLDKIVSITDLTAEEVQGRLQAWIDRGEKD
ncbi:MAG TPA: DUF167 domain-containing protein [Anaerolineales bacterium]|nr:DUF167 domain-containing protein [Anaerolineales bacterium]